MSLEAFHGTLFTHFQHEAIDRAPALSHLNNTLI